VSKATDLQAAAEAHARLQKALNDFHERRSDEWTRASLEAIKAAQRRMAQASPQSSFVTENCK